MAKASRTAAFRLTATVVALFVLVAIVSVGAIYWQTSTLLTRQMAGEAISEAQRLRGEAARQPTAMLARQVDDLTQRNGPQRYVLVRAGDGVKLAGNLAQWPAELEADGQAAVFRYTAADGSAHLAVGVGQVLAGGTRLLVARDAAVLQRLGGRVGWWFALAIAVMSVLGLALGLAISQLVLGRIAQITATSERIMAGRLSERIPLSGSGDELDGLAANLNRMLARIEELMASFREVSDNIAHDLKTPLNRLRNRAEEALNDESDGASHRESLERILAEADDLIRTFNALLQVARLEAGAADEAREVCDLADIAGDLVEFYTPVAEESGAVIAFEGRQGTLVRANRQLLGQALTNLIENALKYGRSRAGCAAAGSAEIMVSVAPCDDGAVVSVGDRGRGIRPEERQRALKRFGRLDSSRSQPGTGLGLSLVAAVARVHGGRVELSDNDPGLIAKLVLPSHTGQAVGVA